MKVTINLNGQPATQRYWALLSSRAEKKTAELVMKTTEQLQDQIKENMRPNEDTGDMINAVQIRKTDTGMEVFSDDPGQWRMEFGFMGLDSLGRLYHQGPNPAWRMAIAQQRLAMKRDMRYLIKEILT